MIAETDHQSAPLALPFCERSSVSLAVEICRYLECRQVDETDTRMSLPQQRLEHALVVVQGQKALGPNLK